MNEPFFLGVPTLCRQDLLADCLESAFAGTRAPHLAYVIDNGGGFYNVNPRVRVINPPENLGVARSWNLLHKLTYPRPCVICNDDVTFSPDALEGILACPEPFVAACGWACFLARQTVWERVGYFDEMFMAYFEDNDYARRLALANITQVLPKFGSVTHVGSATLAALPEPHHSTVCRYYDAGKEYYMSKWGGLPDAEHFATPFGL